MTALARILAVFAAAVAGALAGGASTERGPPHLPGFASAADMEQWLATRARVIESSPGRYGGDDSVALEMTTAEAAASADAGSPDGESITNVQEAGVDEGGLVKAAGDLLVVLRRGRLFTISTAGGALSAVDRADAFPPGSTATDVWYDELLIVDGAALVIGYDYRSGATEIVRFDLSPDGRIAFRDAHQIRSADYFSSGNFASRLIGNDLILYAPLPLDDGPWSREVPDVSRVMPAMRPWSGAADAPWRVIASPADVHVSAGDRADPAGTSVLHAVTVCDAVSVPLRCRARGVVGGVARAFYASPDALYLWTSKTRPWDDRARSSPATLVRMPLAGGAPQAIRARGMPIDQFSFRERDGVLNVVLADSGGGEGMWNRGGEGRLNLLRLPLRRFGDGGSSVSSTEMAPLHEDLGRSWSLINRFVGNRLVVGAEREDKAASLLVADVEGTGRTVLRLDGRISRIEPVGSDALVVTQGDGAALNLLDLQGAPKVVARLTDFDGTESETRSHGFFFRPDAGAGGRRGALALPLTSWSLDPGDSVAERVTMIFVRREDRRLSRLGTLDARRLRGFDDGCRASCVDWYGDARPIFLGNRVFALLGYELVEGRFEGRGMREVARLDFSPPAGRD